MSSSNDCYELCIGKVFSNEQEIYKFISEYSKKNRQTFVKGRTSKLHGDLKIKSKLEYYAITYVCKFGTKRPSEAKGIRTARTFKRNCSAFITIHIDHSGEHYKVVKFNDTHNNHEGLEQFYEYLPENRRPNEAEKQEILHEFSLGCKPARLQEFVRDKYNKQVRAKDLVNIAASLKSNSDEDIPNALRILQNDYKADVEIIKDESNYFQGLFFSTLDMQQTFSKFPEIVFVDGTYKLFKNRYTLILFVIEDGNGRSKVVGVGIITNESEPVLASLMEAFKNINKCASDKIIGFMTDKDLTERYVIKKIFPEVKMFICQFHTLRTFNREITTTKLNINRKERETALFFLDKMVKSLSEDAFNYWYEQFTEKAAKPAISYYEKNWHPIKDEWVRYCIFKCNFGNFTNNRIESINSKLKGFLSKYNSLIKFIHDFFKWIVHRYLESTYKDIQHIIKYNVLCDNSNVNSVKMQYKNYITDFAFKIVEEQLEKMKYITFRSFNSEILQGTVQQFSEIITANPHMCTCLHNWSMMLPCRHILAVRLRCNLPLFERTLCSDRWKISVNSIQLVSTSQENAQCLETEENLSSVANISTPVNQKTKVTTIKSAKKSSIGEKRRKLKIITDNLISIASEQTEEKFSQKYDFLKNVLSSWKKNEEIEITNLSENMKNISINSEDSIVKAPSPTLTIARVKNATSCTISRKSKKKNRK